MSNTNVGRPAFGTQEDLVLHAGPTIDVTLSPATRNAFSFSEVAGAAADTARHRVGLRPVACRLTVSAGVAVDTSCTVDVRAAGASLLAAPVSIAAILAAGGTVDAPLLAAGPPDLVAGDVVSLVVTIVDGGGAGRVVNLTAVLTVDRIDRDTIGSTTYSS